MADHTLTLRPHFEAALTALAAETGTPADTIILAAVESALAATANEQAQAARDAKVAALDAAKDTDTKAVIIGRVAAVVVVTR